MSVDTRNGAAPGSHITPLWSAGVASAGLFEHGPDWQGDPPLETFESPTIIFTREGTWRIHRDERVVVSSSAVVLGHAGESYRCSHCDRHPSDRTLFVVLDPARLRSLLEQSDAFPGAAAAEPLPDVGTQPRTRRLAAIATLLETRHPEDQLSIDALVLQLVAELRAPAADQPDVKGRAIAAAIDQARDYLEAHFRERCTLHDLARAVHVSPFHLHRRFRAVTGQTPQQYLDSLRLEHAKRGLREGQQTIRSIAASVGFADAGGFTTWFRRHTGLTPTVYRVRSRLRSTPTIH